jgi:hypothetical protein
MSKHERAARHASKKRERDGCGYDRSMVRRPSPLLLAPLLALACGGGGEGGSSASSGASSSSGNGGGPLATPVQWRSLNAAGAPSARYLHSAVWTGQKMIVWGGRGSGTPPVTASGGAYDPGQDSWSPTASAGAPEARHSHAAVWTGSRMIVWGGYGVSGLAAAGALYDPVADTWKPMSTVNQPSPRLSFTAVWTGSRMIVWGGVSGANVLGSGGIYDPATDAWAPVAASAAPAPRLSHTAVWTGSRMMIWGGSNLFDWLRDGALLDPAAGPGGAWVGTTAAMGAPTARERPTGVWTTSDLLVWGGWTGGPCEDTGGLLSPGAGSWVATAVSGAPTPRVEQLGLWTGNDLVVWGGCGDDLCTDVRGDGGRFISDDKGGRWSPIEAQPGLSARHGHAGVVAGSLIAVWGGRDAAGTPLGDGALGDL